MVHPIDTRPGPRNPQFPRRTCADYQRQADASLAFRDRHWWENWGKTHAYICQRMLFPTSVEEISAAVRMAERDNVPVRAVGGGWSFSDTNLPGDVTTSRPYTLGVEALAEIVPRTKVFTGPDAEPAIASIAVPGPVPDDNRGSLVMFDPRRGDRDPVTGERKQIDDRFSYRGNGQWQLSAANRYGDALLRGLPFDLNDNKVHDITDLRPMVQEGSFRPVIGHGDDAPGTLAMFDSGADRFFNQLFYSGSGYWTLEALGEAPQRLRLDQLFKRLPATAHVRASTPPFSMSLLVPQPQHAYLINTQSLVSSLQQHLPSLLTPEAQAASNHTHYFHVEAGITMEALSALLQHQSPRLAMEATGGSPGATLAGTLATATHGGEHKSKLLVDRIKAIHLVGPGGHQWWIEGETPIADTQHLLTRYPCLKPERIIRNADWLHAVVVSMGCMGVIYSVVLEVVPLFGIHEVIVQSTWRRMLRQAAHTTPEAMRTPVAATNEAILSYLGNGSLNQTHIREDRNQYIDLAIDPNRVAMETEGVHDYNCWILNRERTPEVPFEAKPVSKDMIGGILKHLGKGLERPGVAHHLAQDFKAEWIEQLTSGDFFRALEGFFNALGGFHDLKSRVISMLERLGTAADPIDTALELVSGPIDSAHDVVAANAIVSSFFAGLLGIEDGRAESTDAASKVGAIGFPASGIMGTAIEIAMKPADAFSFIQAEILDHIRGPFWGYVSVRVTPKTEALLGMQQWDTSVMIEVVAFATHSARGFVVDLQRRTLDRIRNGTLDAMVHWGLENSLVNGNLLRAIPAINGRSPTKLETFIQVRRSIKAAAAGSPPVFDNAFTRRIEV